MKDEAKAFLTHAEARRDLHNGRRWLDNKAAAALDAHLAECAECRAYAADVAALEPALARALHARWDGVEAPRAAPKAEEAEAPKRQPRRLNPAWGLAGLALLLVAALGGVPYLAGVPLEGTGEPAITLGPVATGIGTLIVRPVVTAVAESEGAALERSLFVVDWGTFEGLPEATTVISVPRVLAWDAANEQVLWAVEVGRAPRLAVDPNGERVFVVSQPKAGVETLAGLTYNGDNSLIVSDDWPLRLTVLDATNGETLLTVDLGEASGEGNSPWAWTGPVGAAHNLLYVHRYTTSDNLAAINLDTGEWLAPRWTLCANGYPQEVQLAPDGTAVYALCAPIRVPGKVWVQITRFGPFDPIHVEVPELNGVGSWGNGMVLSHDGRRLYVADTLQGFLGEIDTARGVVARTTLYKPGGRHEQAEAVMSLSPNGRLLYLGTLTTSRPAQDIWAVDTADLKAVAHRGMLPSPTLTGTTPPNIRTFATDWTGNLYVATDQGLAVFDMLDELMRFRYPKLAANVTQLIPYPRPGPIAATLPTPDVSGLSLVAFETNRDGTSEIYVMRSNGVEARNLTQRHGPDRVPVWSPDGRYLAYLADRGEATDVMVLNVEHVLATSDHIPPVRVMRGSATMEINDRLEWSPDGTRLAVSFWRQTGPDTTTPVIQLLDVAAALGGVDSPPPVELAYNGYDPKFSPDGTRLLYGGFAAGAPALFVEDLASGEQRRFPASESSAPGEHWAYRGYDWSPDGRFVAYLRVGPWTGQWPDFTLASDARAEIVTAPADGSDYSVIATLGPELNGVVGLEYSPNGRYLLFVADEVSNGCWKPHLMDLASLVVTQVHGACYTPRTALPSWSPDSRLLVFSASWTGGVPGSGGAGTAELTALNVPQALADPNNAQPVRLTHWVGDDLSPQWRP